MEVIHLKGGTDMTKLLADVPRGMWVALTPDEDRVLAYDVDLGAAQEKGRLAGEANPLMVRKPEEDMMLFL